MKDDFVFNVLSFLFAILAVYTLFSNMMFYSLHKDHWHCVKAKIIDNENLDQVECILYERKNNVEG